MFCFKCENEITNGTVCDKCGYDNKAGEFFFPLGEIKLTNALSEFVIEDGVLLSYEGDAERVAIPVGVTEIGEGVFKERKSIKEVVIPEGVTSIGIDAFFDCENLKSVIIPNSVMSIGGNAFSYCKSLESVTIPDGVTSIGWMAFGSCDSLKSVTIPDSVINVHVEAFSGCKSLTSIDVDENNAMYSSNEGVLFNKTKTTLVQYPNGRKSVNYTIPNTVTSIGRSAFFYCENIKSVIIADSVTRIGSFAFMACASLESIIIPDSVTSIGWSAFSWCKSLKSVTVPDSVTSIGDHAFLNCDNLTDVKISEALLKKSQGAFLDTLYDKIKKEIAKEKQEQFRAMGLCQHCGGQFRGLFKKICRECGEPKDY